jgi:DeoR/GlpR family transcriptional regulator of sugar metabolism
VVNSADKNVLQPTRSQPLIREERCRLIQQEVSREGLVTVAALASHLGVSPMTIRRDLSELEGQGILTRVHGGAIAADQAGGPVEPPMRERMLRNADEKRQIAKVVAAVTLDGETIFIGSGSTALAVAEAIRNRRNLTVVTNALTVANALLHSRGISLIVVGGFLRPSESSLIGHIAERALQDIRVDKVIMGIGGVDPEHGLTGDNLQELMTDRAILGTTDTVIVVADHSKLGHVAASMTAPITAATRIVTGRQAPSEVIRAIRQRGVEVLLVD